MLGNLDIDNQYHYHYATVKRRLSGAWPPILGGACRLIYDALLLAQFRSVTPPTN
jgi:hypothetical protein